MQQRGAARPIRGRGLAIFIATAAMHRAEGCFGTASRSDVGVVGVDLTLIARRDRADPRVVEARQTLLSRVDQGKASQPTSMLRARALADLKVAALAIAADATYVGEGRIKPAPLCKPQGSA
jgi:hypothetical protein